MRLITPFPLKTCILRQKMSLLQPEPTLNCSARWKCSGESCLCFGLQDDCIAQPFQLSDKPSLNLLFIDVGKVVSSFLVIELTGLDHVIENHQDTVTNSHRRFFAPSSCANPTVLLTQIRLGMTCRMGRLDEHCFGPAIPLTRATVSRCLPPVS